MTNLTTVQAVLGYLGRDDLSGAQAAEIAALLPAADAAVQSYADRTWLGGAITGETYVPDGPLLYLRQRPVASVEAVTAGWYFNAVPVTLGLGTDYRVRDLQRGVLLLTPWRTGRPTDRPYETVNVSYTPAAAVPADASLAATKWVAWQLGPSLGEATSDIKRYSVGQELTVERFDPHPSGMPADIAALLDGYRGLVFA